MSSDVLIATQYLHNEMTSATLIQAKQHDMSKIDGQSSLLGKINFIWKVWKLVFQTKVQIQIVLSAHFPRSPEDADDADVRLCSNAGLQLEFNYIGSDPSSFEHIINTDLL